MCKRKWGEYSTTRLWLVLSACFSDLRMSSWLSLLLLLPSVLTVAATATAYQAEMEAQEEAEREAQRRAAESQGQGALA